MIATAVLIGAVAGVLAREMAHGYRDERLRYAAEERRDRDWDQAHGIGGRRRG